MAPPPPSSSFSLLLCVSMFLAVSSVGKALSSDHVEPDAAWDSLWGCPSVTRCISTCVEYLKGHQDTPSSECCLNMRFFPKRNFYGLGVAWREKSGVFGGDGEETRRDFPAKPSGV
nr:hypothetical protein Itr_chr09CG03720 [Ipomoea trifida]